MQYSWLVNLLNENILNRAVTEIDTRFTTINRSVVTDVPIIPQRQALATVYVIAWQYSEQMLQRDLLDKTPVTDLSGAINHIAD